MPLHEAGYRRWSGKEQGFLFRWFAITNKGFELAMRSQIVRRVMFLAWLPALFFGAGFYFFENFVEQSALKRSHDAVQEVGEEVLRQLEERGDELPEELQELRETAEDKIEQGLEKEEEIALRQLRRSNLGGFLSVFGQDGTDKVLKSLLGEDDKYRRRTVWSFFLLKFLKGPQGLALVLLMGWVSAPLIAKDLRTKAFLLYFSRPLSRWNYILGKLMILVVLSMVITTLPAFILYFVGIGLSPNLEALQQTWDLPFRLVAVSMLHIVPASLVALMFSALTTDSRFAHFAWYAMWILGYATWSLIGSFINFAAAQAAQDPSVFSRPISLQDGGAWVYVSFYHTINLAQGWAMGVTDRPVDSFVAFVLLCVISLVAFAVTWHRVSKAVLL